MVKIKPLVVKLLPNTTVVLQGSAIKITGTKGELTVPYDKAITVMHADDKLELTRTSDEKNVRALHGLTRALITNAIEGVNNGFSKTLELSGVGYRAQVNGSELILSVGFSHPVKFTAPHGITFALVDNKIKISGIDKHLVGQTAHTIRAVREPEPYKGKGIKYEGEKVRRKAGKAAAKIGGAK